MAMRRLGLLIPIALLVGCSTVSYPRVGSPVGVPPATRPVVGVVEPLARLDADQPEPLYGELWTYESEADLKAAAHLIVNAVSYLPPQR